MPEKEKCVACRKAFESTELIAVGYLKFCQECHDSVFITCTECSSKVNRLTALCHEERVFCADCATHHFTRCYVCYNQVPTDATETDGRIHVCRSCIERHNYIRCIHCNSLHPSHEMMSHNGQMCVSCFNERYFSCSHCSRVHTIDQRVDGHSFSICRGCFDRHYTACIICQSAMRIGTGIQTMDGIICRHCDQDLDIVRRYNYKPRPFNFHTVPEQEIAHNTMFMGVEVEMDKGGRKHYNGKKLIELANHLSPLREGVCYIKHDGSLQDGFELVTHPMTYEFHKYVMPWPTIMSTAKDMGYRADDVETCGLHIHMSRKFFGNGEIEQDYNIMKLLYLYEKFWDKIMIFSRRKRPQVERYANRYGFSEEPERILHRAKGDPSKYRAVNLMNQHTIEFRVFKGTLQPEIFYATIQFVKLLAELTTQYDVDGIRRLRWGEIVDMGGAYAELMEYIRDRQLV